MFLRIETILPNVHTEYQTRTESNVDATLNGSIPLITLPLFYTVTAAVSSIFSPSISFSLSLSLIHSFHLNNTKLLLCNIGQRILREDYICSIPIRCLYSFLRLLLVSCFLFRFLVLSTPHPLCGVCVCMYLYILLCSIIC